MIFYFSFILFHLYNFFYMFWSLIISVLLLNIISILFFLGGQSRGKPLKQNNQKQS